jgi:hypothetical protein
MEPGEVVTQEPETFNPEEFQPEPEPLQPAPPSEAPHGYNEDGSVKAPYGYTKKGKVKILPGRPTEVNGSVNDSQVASDEDELKKELSKESPAPPPVPAPVKKDFRVFINGAMFLLAMDFIFPGAIATVFNLFSKEKVNKDDLCMTDSEREDFKDLADEVVKDLLGGMSPLQQFFIFTSIIYGSKLAYAPKRLQEAKGGKGEKK